MNELHLQHHESIMLYQLAQLQNIPQSAALLKAVRESLYLHRILKDGAVLLVREKNGETRELNIPGVINEYIEKKQRDRKVK